MGISQVVVLFICCCLPSDHESCNPKTQLPCMGRGEDCALFGNPPTDRSPKKDAGCPFGGTLLLLTQHTLAMSGLGVGEGGRRAARGGREATDEGEGADDHHLSQTTTHIKSQPSNE